MSDLSEFILEMRYRPNPKILDYRGSWAEAIAHHMKLREWKIVENRVDVYEGEKNEHAFVGFRNAGYAIQNNLNSKYFSERAIRFMDYLFNLEGFEKKPYIQRIGVRTKLCKEFGGSFKDLRNKFIANYLSLTDKAKSVFDAELKDIGAPLNFTDKYGNFNTMSGPMDAEQMPHYFKKSDDCPEIGLFIDIDYWKTPNTEMDKTAILGLIKQFADSGWRRLTDITNVIFNG